MLLARFSKTLFSRRRCGLHRVGSLLALAGAILLAAWIALPSRAQEGSDRLNYTRQRHFLIPITEDQPGGRKGLKEMILYASVDEGMTWQRSGSASPEQQGFHFRAERDGLFTFALQTMDSQGRLYPPSVQGLQPSVKVYVDTQKPVISLRSAPYRDGSVGVEWDIRDETLDLTTFNLDYRLAGTPDWIPVAGQPLAAGVRYWNPGTTQAIEVRLRVRDLAKNEEESKLTLALGTQEYRSSSNNPDAETPVTPTRRGQTPVRFVNSKRISLNYEIKEQGPSGVSAIELWTTRDTTQWDKYNEQTFSDQKPPRPPYTFDVVEEGVYGFTLLVRSGVNESERPPRAGDQPQVWVEVDTTKPMVEWVNVDVGRAVDRGTVTITWKATDKNIAREPITLYYAKEPKDGQWTPIKSNLENSGRFVWQMPPTGIPYQFYVRVEAKDKANNIGFLEYAKVVKVDLARPKGVILSVDPVPNPDK